MWGAFAAIGTLLLLGLKIGIYFYKKNRAKPTHEEDIQRLHNAIAKGDAGILSDLFDGLRRPPGESDKVRYDDPTPS